MINSCAYKYIKGKEVVMEEHMYSATELAKLYGLYTLNNNPNGILVTSILRDYVKKKNINVSEYYYPHSKGVMRVYPKLVYEDCLYDFILKLKDNEEYIYYTKNAEDKNIKINYKFKEFRYENNNGKKKVISINERRN